MVNIKEYNKVYICKVKGMINLVKNYMEILVEQIFNDIKGKYNICKHDDCINNIKSTALNNLPPVYFLSSVSEAEKKLFYWIDKEILQF